MACFLLIEPVKMIFVNLKNLVLFAPEQDIMDNIRFAAEKHMDKVYCDIEFLDVIQTGRKTWVEIYFKSHNDLINTKILLQLRNDIRAELRKSLIRFMLNLFQVCLIKFCKYDNVLLKDSDGKVHFRLTDA